MYFENLDHSTYILRLEKGEELLSSLSAFVTQKNIINGTFSGIGSVEDPSLAHYNVSKKKYSEQKLTGVFELTSLIGNISHKQHEPVIHPHVTISNEKMECFGGHLVYAHVSATVEITINTYSSEFEKEFDSEIGRNLWKLQNRLNTEDNAK